MDAVRSMEAKAGESDAEGLPRLFSDAERRMDQLENQSSQEIQNAVPSVISDFEKATKWVSVLGLFSTNEDVDEVSTNDLRYFLLPAYLAHCTLQLQSERLGRLETSEIYALDFLRRCKNYSIPGSEQIPESVFRPSSPGESSQNIQRSQQEQLAHAASNRVAKIAAYKQKSELKEKIAVLKSRVLSGIAEEEVERDYYLTLIKSWILEMLDELPAIKEEKKLLELHSKESNGASEHVLQKPSETPKTFIKVNRPITIVRNELQKQVFGAGYRSLPLLSIEEFYDELVQEGALPAPGSAPTSNLNHMGPTRDQLEQDDIELERKEETDDPQYLIDTRNRDDFRDTHRTGWGNRIGKG